MEYLGPGDFSRIWHAAVFFCQSINEYLLNGQAMFSTYLPAMQDKEWRTGFFPQGDFNYIREMRLKVVKYEIECES